MKKIEIDFAPNGLGRVEFEVKIPVIGDRRKHQMFAQVTFKLDTASDFTTLSLRDLKKLGYKLDELKKCDFHIDSKTGERVLVNGRFPIQYMDDFMIIIGQTVIKNVRVFFVTNESENLRSLFGGDITKYFNYTVNSDERRLTLWKMISEPDLIPGEIPIEICAYTDENES